jgi:hypothetical protein
MIPSTRFPVNLSLVLDMLFARSGARLSGRMEREKIIKSALNHHSNRAELPWAGATT